MWINLPIYSQKGPCSIYFCKLQLVFNFLQPPPDFHPFKGYKCLGNVASVTHGDFFFHCMCRVHVILKFQPRTCWYLHKIHRYPDTSRIENCVSKMVKYTSMLSAFSFVCFLFCMYFFFLSRANDILTL